MMRSDFRVIGAALIGMMAIGAMPVNAGVIYVDVDASPGGDGSEWSGETKPANCTQADWEASNIDGIGGVDDCDYWPFRHCLGWGG